EESWLVRRCGDDDRTTHAFLSEVVFDKLADLAAPFPDKADHDDASSRLACHHTHERALSDAGRCEDSDTLSFAASQQAVDGANARGQRFGSEGSVRGVLRAAV